MIQLRVKDWDEHFENNRTRELKRMEWVPMPVKHDGDGYTELLDHPNGAAHFGAWCAIVEVAAKCDPRGTLIRNPAGRCDNPAGECGVVATSCGELNQAPQDGARPHNSASLARITRIPATIFDEAIPRLISIGWLERIYFEKHEVMEIPQEGAVKPQEGASSRVRARARAGMEWNGTEWNGTKIKAAAAPPARSRRSLDSCPGFDAFWSAWPSHHRKVNRRKCLIAWRNERCDEVAAAIMANLEASKRSDAWTDEAGKFAPAPLVWLNQRRWEAVPPPHTETPLERSARICADMKRKEEESCRTKRDNESATNSQPPGQTNSATPTSPNGASA